MFTWLKKTWMELDRKEKYLLIMVSSLFLLSVMTLLAVYYRNLNYLSSPVRESDIPNQVESTIPGQNVSFSYDIIIYGGTPAGITAAVAAAREGATVAIIEPTAHLGGIITSGLSFSDINNPAVIGGLAKEFFERIGQYYGLESTYRFEPHIAERVISDIIRESGVTVYDNHRLKENAGVAKSGTTITKITTENNDTFSAKVFIDCSYEGDLMAQAGVLYTYGRESTEQYDEPLAGVRPFSLMHNFTYPVSAYNEKGELLPGLAANIQEKVGSADQKIQAYTFRLCLTDDPNNKQPFTKPQNYDASQYELLLKWLQVLQTTKNIPKLRLSDIFYLGKLPNSKADANNSGPFSSDYIGASWDYPEAGYERRAEIIDTHKSYLQGLLYFLANDKRVPIELRESARRWGLAKDEFADNNNWPYQLYIREARRMIGDFVMTQKDLQKLRLKNDSIGLGSYWIDSHNTQRCITSEGTVQNEGDVLFAVEPYQIPYRIMLPKKTQATNLLVPVCMSASHIAYASLRMEAQYMILGQAAGTAAQMAVGDQCNVQDINTEFLKLNLQKNGAVLDLSE